mgnify:CR=1 FL=1
MSTKPIAPLLTTPPSRFREAQARGERLGRQLKRLGKVPALDEALLARIGRAFGERDELGHALANAIRTRAVSMELFRTALEKGIDAVPDAPAVLRAYFEAVTTVPRWVDFDRVNEGGRVLRRLGQNAADVLLQLSLIGGYRFGGPPDLLVATGGLAGSSTRRRLAETQKWIASPHIDDAALLRWRDLEASSVRRAVRPAASSGIHETRRSVSLLPPALVNAAPPRACAASAAASSFRMPTSASCVCLNAMARCPSSVTKSLPKASSILLSARSLSPTWKSAFSVCTGPSVSAVLVASKDASSAAMPTPAAHGGSQPTSASGTQARL